MSSIKERNNYSCASSTNEDGCVMTTPGVVARLMGLDAIPGPGVTKSIYTSSHDSYDINRSPEYSNDNMIKPLDSRTKRMPRSPIERFQTESLPSSSIKKLSKPHHRFLSPINYPG